MKWMTCRWSILVGSILFISLIALPASHAQEETPAGSAVASAPTESFTNDGMAYAWRPELRAINHTEGKVSLRQGGRRTAEDVESMEVMDILERKGRYTIYRPLPASPTGSAIRGVLHHRRSIQTFPIVINRTTGRLGVVTDGLMLKLRDPETATAIAGEYGLSFSYMNDLIRTAVYTLAEEVNIKDLRERLMHDPRIERVTLSIVDHIRRPR